MYKIIIEDDEGKTTIVPLLRDEVTIGRKEGNTIRLTERNISRRHAKLVRVNGAVQIEDLQSYNGIRVNGTRIDGRAPVHEGDRIQIGDYQIALKLESVQPAAPASPPEDEQTKPFDKHETVGGSPDDPTAVNPLLQGESPARVVVVSSNFARQEFVLEQPTTVIGRTDDNDVVIDHRSISRHHAKIVREDGHYHVVDLDSANGVRVNGQPYDKVELRRGDHIDLGHVRFRFVAPGENFVFDRDARVVEVADRRAINKGIALAVGAALVVAAIAGWKLLGSHADRGPQPSDIKIQIATLNTEAEQLMRTGDWDGALAKCDQGIKLDPSADFLRDKRVRAESERKLRDRLKELQAAATANECERAMTTFQSFGEDSFYRNQAVETFQGVKTRCIHNALERARKALQANRCDEVRQHCEQVLLLDGENSEAQEINRRCGGSAAARSGGKTEPKRAAAAPTTAAPERAAAPAAEPKHTQEEPEPVEPKAESGDDPEKLLADAMDAYVNGRYGEAVEKARKANHSGNNPKAWRLIGASACQQKNRDEAVKAWNRLSQVDRQFVKYICNRNEITIP